MPNTLNDPEDPALTMSDHGDYAPESLPESPVLSRSGEGFDERPINGLYIDMAPFGLEKIWDYEPGGHHVVHLGDHLGREGEYKVIHKLGSGGVRQRLVVPGPAQWGTPLCGAQDTYGRLL